MTDTFDVKTDPVTIVPDAATADPEAPFGRFQNGKPRKSAPTSKRKTSGRTAAPKASGAPRRPAGKAPSFTKMLTGGFSMLGVAVTGIGMRRRSRAVVADGMALRLAAKPLAEGLNELAQISPALQRVLSKAGPAVPATGLVLALLELSAQLAANHGRSLPGFEVHSPDDLVAAAEYEAQQYQEQQHQEQRPAGPTPADMPQHQPEHAFASSVA